MPVETTGPTWLAYATPIVATAAFVIAVLSLIVSFRSYRQGHPRVVVQASGGAGRAHGEIPGNANVEVKIRNRYGGIVEVDRITLRSPRKGYLRNLDFVGNSVRGEPLPYELRERRMRTWTMDVAARIKAPGMRSSQGYNHALTWLPAELRGCEVLVELGDGQSIRTRVKGLSPYILNHLFEEDYLAYVGRGLASPSADAPPA